MDYLKSIKLIPETNGSEFRLEIMGLEGFTEKRKEEVLKQNS